MAKFLNPQGLEVTADEALINGRIRPNYREILTNGESVATDIFHMDAARGIFGEPQRGAIYHLDTTSTQRMADANKTNAHARDAIRDNRYAGFPMIEAAEGENPSQPTMGKSFAGDASGAIAAIRNARYS